MQKYESLYNGKIVDTRRFTTTMEDHYDIEDEFGTKMVNNTKRISHAEILVDVDDSSDIVILTIYKAKDYLVQIGQESYSKKVWDMIHQKQYIEGLKRRYK